MTDKLGRVLEAVRRAREADETATEAHREVRESIRAARDILLALHPAREEFLRRGAALSRTLLAVTAVGAVPFVAYALDMGAQSRDLAGPPHHVQRLSTMAALAVAIVLTALLAGLRTRGWRVPAWSAGLAAITFGLASVVFPDQEGAVGRGWGGVAIAGGVLFIAVAEWEGTSARATPEPRSRVSSGPSRRHSVFGDAGKGRSTVLLPKRELRVTQEQRSWLDRAELASRPFFSSLSHHRRSPVRVRLAPLHELAASRRFMARSPTTCEIRVLPWPCSQTEA